MIQWCNDNVGFATIVLSALTLLVYHFSVYISSLSGEEYILINQNSVTENRKR